MSQGVKQPIGQKRLTNVAVVRLKKKGIRFEVACYKNKVVNWRNEVEKDLDEVLQTTTIFNNVSKGILAKREDLVDVFGTDDEEKICIRILAEGDMQVSDKERDVELSSMFKDVASIIAEKCVNPGTQRPYTISMIERALKDVHFSVDPKRGAKQQALHALQQLKENLPIERARMRLKLQIPVTCRNDLMQLLAGQQATVESEDLGLHNSQLTVICLVDPGAFRGLNTFVQSSCDGEGRMEVVSLAATEEAPTVGKREADVSSSIRSSSVATKPVGQEDAPATATPSRAVHSRQEQAHAGPSSQVVYARGSIADLPDEHASRRERFAELDNLQPGWQVELCSRGAGSAIDAIFYSPSGQKVGAFANARRAALQYSKQQSSS
ncbi:Ribosome maturation protein SBDS [Coccomyxa sp. Obi]|nr:Ribosome maturation protein SBDS [Coccomyxa sp. Obi]